jgi:hypothetical protein
MLTGDTPLPRSTPIWNAFWSGGISNPMEVLEQITYLLFIKPPGRRAHAGGKQGR